MTTGVDPRVLSVSIPVHSLTITGPPPMSGPLAELVAEIRVVADEIKALAGHSGCDGWRWDDGVLICGCGVDLTELAQGHGCG